MPTLHLYLMKGRDNNKKRLLVKELTNVISKVLEVNDDSVKIILSETTPENYASAGVLLIDKNI